MTWRSSLTTVDRSARDALTFLSSSRCRYRVSETRRPKRTSPQFIVDDRRADSGLGRSIGPRSRRSISAVHWAMVRSSFLLNCCKPTAA